MVAIIFAGLRYNVSQIRSLEGIDIAWADEAANISHTSWKILIPTIHKDRSESGITFNPDLETDATNKRLVRNPQANSLVRHVLLCDNPRFVDLIFSANCWSSTLLCAAHDVGGRHRAGASANGVSLIGGIGLAIFGNSVSLSWPGHL
jgi:hypothetical protein